MGTRADPGRSFWSVTIYARDTPPLPSADDLEVLELGLRLSRNAVDGVGTQIETRHRSRFLDRAGIANTGEIHLLSRKIEQTLPKLEA